MAYTPAMAYGKKKRRRRGYHDAAADLTERVLAFCRLDRPGRIKLRNSAESHSHAFDWSRLAVSYHEAHDKALAAAES